MARRRNRGRDISGVLLLNKPAGMSSNSALQIAKRLYGASKAGHTGSLDPLATGMLPICFGEATKFSQFLLDADKSYRVTAKLGINTNTSDADGEVIKTRPFVSSAADVEAALMSFVGANTQIPSMFSAIKHQGQPLYKLARQGIEIERKTRHVTLYALRWLELRGDELDFEVDCSKGTYVRSLVEDLGEKLGCGGHVQALHRISAGAYPTDQMRTVDALKALQEAGGTEALDAVLLPTYSSVEDWPRVELGDEATFYLLRGQSVMATDRPSEGGVTLFRASDKAFLGVGQVTDDGMIAPRRLIVTGDDS